MLARDMLIPRCRPETPGSTDGHGLIDRQGPSPTLRYFWALSDEIGHRNGSGTRRAGGERKTHRLPSILPRAANLLDVVSQPKTKPVAAGCGVPAATGQRQWAAIRF